MAWAVKACFGTCGMPGNDAVNSCTDSDVTPPRNVENVSAGKAAADSLSSTSTRNSTKGTSQQEPPKEADFLSAFNIHSISGHLFVPRLSESASLRTWDVLTASVSQLPPESDESLLHSAPENLRPQDLQGLASTKRGVQVCATPAALLRDIQDLHYLARGASCVVFKGIWQGAPCAVKFMTSKQAFSPDSSCVRECLLGAEMSHPNLVTCFRARCLEIDDEFLENALIEKMDRETAAAEEEAAKERLSMESFQSNDGFGPVPPSPAPTASGQLAYGVQLARHAYSCSSSKPFSLGNSTSQVQLPRISNHTSTTRAGPDGRRIQTLSQLQIAADQLKALDVLSIDDDEDDSPTQGCANAALQRKSSKHAATRSTCGGVPGTMYVPVNGNGDPAGDVVNGATAKPSAWAPCVGVAQQGTRQSPRASPLGNKDRATVAEPVAAPAAHAPRTLSPPQHKDSQQQQQLGQGDCQYMERLQAAITALVQRCKLDNSISPVHTPPRTPTPRVTINDVNVHVRPTPFQEAVLACDSPERPPATQHANGLPDMEVFRHGTNGQYGDRLHRLHLSDRSGPIASLLPAHNPFEAGVGWHDVLQQLKAEKGQVLMVIICELCDMGVLTWASNSKKIFVPSDVDDRKLKVRALIRTVREVALGLQHLHSNGVIHGDLKLSNVCLVSSRMDRRGFEAKLTDFGLSRVLKGTAGVCGDDDGATALMAEQDGMIEKADWGTTIYMAPEHLQGRMCKASDIWSLGVMIWEMAHGKQPYADIPLQEVVRGVASGELRLPWSPTVPSAIVDLGQWCIRHTPQDRPTCHQVIKSLVEIEDIIRRSLHEATQRQPTLRKLVMQRQRSNLHNNARTNGSANGT